MFRFGLRRVAASIALAFMVISLPFASAAAQTAQRLDDVSLSQMLNGLGYDVKSLSNGYLITIPQESGWTVYLQVVLSPDKTKIGMNANLGDVDEDSVTAAQWMGLLAANQDVDPSSFYYDKSLKRLYLHRVLDNTLVTPQLLRQQIENFVSNVESTTDDWSFVK